MSIFGGEVFVPHVALPAVGVLDGVMAHFRERGYRIVVAPAPAGGWSLVIAKGGALRTVVGFKTALRIDVVNHNDGLYIRTHGALLRSRIVIVVLAALFAVAVPLLSWVLVAPLLLLHTWGFVRQAALDNEATKVVQVMLNRQSRLNSAITPHPTSWDGEATLKPQSDSFRPYSAPDRAPARAGRPTEVFCTGCGSRLTADAQLCGICGETC